MAPGVTGSSPVGRPTNPAPCSDDSSARCSSGATLGQVTHSTFAPHRFERRTQMEGLRSCAVSIRGGRARAHLQCAVQFTAVPASTSAQLWLSAAVMHSDASIDPEQGKACSHSVVITL